MKSNETNCDQMEIYEGQANHVKPSEIKWNQAKPTSTKWDQV
jgi:hypothetical protein